MATEQLNKYFAGYHLLMILSAVDHEFNVEEDLVIRDWLAAKCSTKENLDEHMAIISALKPEEWEQHFADCMKAYEADSTEDDRHDLVMYAAELISADKRVHENENKYVDKLFDTWFPEAG
ncbi:MAG: hypothetical protein RL660_1641 [Bacteroidota bacterium]|jgi:uncharacterized tellurite resistance protein B-like protein